MKTLFAVFGKFAILFAFKIKQEKINISTIAVIGHFSEASVIDSKYIKMTRQQDFK